MSSARLVMLLEPGTATTASIGANTGAISMDELDADSCIVAIRELSQGARGGAMPHEPALPPLPVYSHHSAIRRNHRGLQRWRGTGRCIQRGPTPQAGSRSGP